MQASQWATVRLVEDGGLRLVDVRVMFKWLPAHLPPPDGGESGMRPALAGDVDRLCAIAGDVHPMTRFYNDPGFPRDLQLSVRRPPLFADLTWTEQARVTDAILRFRC